jgi:TPR repeat protein
LAAFDWPEERKRALYAAMQRGIAVYRVDHGRAVLLDRCSIGDRYTNLRIAPQRELVYLGPLPAGQRDGRSQAWELVTTQFSRALVPMEASRHLEGSCRGATHTVRAVTIGVANHDAARSERDTLLDLELQPLSRPPKLRGAILPRSREADQAPIHDRICSPADSARCAELCRAGSARSCYNLALLPYSEDETPSARASTAKLFQAACDRNVPEACTGVGLGYGSTAAGHDLAAPFYERACAAGEAAGCYLRGKVESLKHDPLQHADAVASWYERACRGGLASGCEELAGWVRAVRPKRFAMDDRELLDHFARACKAGVMRACAGWAAMLEEGRGSPQNRALAEDIHGFACRHGWVNSCLLLEKRGLDDAGNPELGAR